MDVSLMPSDDNINDNPLIPESLDDKVKRAKDYLDQADDTLQTSLSETFNSYADLIDSADRELTQTTAEVAAKSVGIIEDGEREVIKLAEKLAKKPVEYIGQAYASISDAGGSAPQLLSQVQSLNQAYASSMPREQFLPLSWNPDEYSVAPHPDGFGCIWTHLASHRQIVGDCPPEYQTSALPNHPDTDLIPGKKCYADDGSATDCSIGPTTTFSHREEYDTQSQSHTYIDDWETTTITSFPPTCPAPQIYLSCPPCSTPAAIPPTVPVPPPPIPPPTCVYTYARVYNGAKNSITKEMYDEMYQNHLNEFTYTNVDQAGFIYHHFGSKLTLIQEYKSGPKDVCLPTTPQPRPTPSPTPIPPIPPGIPPQPTPKVPTTPWAPGPWGSGDGWINLDKSGTCDTLESALNTLKPPDIMDLVHKVFDTQGKGGESLNHLLDPTVAAMLGSPDDLINQIINKIVKMAYGGIIWGSGIIEKFGIHHHEATNASLLISAIPKLIEKYTGIPLEQYVQPLQYYRNWANPFLLPGQTSIDALYQANKIDDKEWECRTRMLGNLPNIHRLLRDAISTRLNVSDILELNKRKYITDDETKKELRSRGVTDESQFGQWKQLNNYIPPSSDVIRMMVKEVENEEQVREDGLDQNFDTAYKGKLSHWFHQNGIDDETAKYYWRAHWQEISPTQAYEMLRRLRPNRNKDGLVFTKERMARILRDADYPPGLIPYLMAVSYHPITRTDLIKGINNGTIKRLEAVESLLDLGYDQDNSEKLADILINDASRQQQSRTGQWTYRKIMQEYKKGTITQVRAKVLLSKTISDPDKIDDIISDADALVEAGNVEKCIKGIRRKFMIGEFDNMEAVLQLNKLGIDAFKSSSLTAGWSCELMTRSKEPTVKYLLEWVQKGIITAPECYRRLNNLGYTPLDSQNIMRNAAVKWAEEEAAEAVKLAEKRKKEAETEKKRQIKEEKEAEKKRLL